MEQGRKLTPLDTIRSIRGVCHGLVQRVPIDASPGQSLLLEPLGAKPAPAHVPGDAMKPCPPGVRIAKLVSIAPCLDQRFLGEIFGDIGTARDRGTQPYERSTISQ